MTDYDFSALNDKEFEALCTDLLSAIHGHRFERFKPGRDAGVDGRYFAIDGSEVILQCKHWQATPLERLFTHIEKIERPKIEKLNPSRYILGVSHQLSRTDKSKLKELLSPYVLRDDDILGREDLNDILSREPLIERRHYKLWIRSTSVLQHILNKAIHDRSAFSLDEIVREAKFYVPTKLHGAAIDKLETLGTVIVTGAPGIGKTTLANHMVLHYVDRGFSLMHVAEDLREAEGVYGDGQKQIFYFDDFLGRNYLEALSGHEGSHITQFIRRISHDKTKRFILTSRTTILNQGKALIDILSQNNIERNELEVRIESLQEIDKAKILYNHIWHSSLSAEHVDELYVERRYRRIISHRNFNPRLIRFITDTNAISEHSASQYWGYAKELLDNPTRVWQHPFEAQLDDFGRGIVLLVAINQRPIRQFDLAEAYARFTARAENNGLTGRRDFLLTLRHLVGSFLSRAAASAPTAENAVLDLFNPSIGDYVLHRYSTDLPTLRAALISHRSASSVETLSGLISTGLLSNGKSIELASNVIREGELNGFIGYTSDHIGAAAAVILNRSQPSAAPTGLLVSAANFILATDPPFLLSQAASVLEWAAGHMNIDKTALELWVARACARAPYPDEFQAIERILATLDGDARARIWPALEAAKVAYIADNARHEIDAGEVYEGSSLDDLGLARERLGHLAEEKLEQYGVTPTEQNVSAVIDAFDIDSYATTYFSDYDTDDYQDHHVPEPIDQIDDLFDRG